MVCLVSAAKQLTGGDCTACPRGFDRLNKLLLMSYSNTFGRLKIFYWDFTAKYCGK